MKLIVGLGNPGVLYKDSRHNIGFSVVRALAKSYNLSFKREGSVAALIGRRKASGLILALPLTFMNLSGSAVARLVKKYKVDLQNLLVVCDDLDLEPGRIRIRPDGSSAGHRGLSSIIEALKSDKFCRLRLGIGRPKTSISEAQYVLKPFSRQEKKEAQDLAERAVYCCQVWINEGVDKAMNTFNRRVSQDE